MYEFIKKVEQAINKVQKYSFIIGIVDNKNRKKQKNKKITDITNAELLSVHENGSSIRKIPRRPILEYTIEGTDELINKALEKAIEMFIDGKDDNAVEKFLEQTAVRIANYAKKNAYQRAFNFQQLKKSTIKNKGSDIPLVDTGEMIRNITCVLYKK